MLNIIKELIKWLLKFTVKFRSSRTNDSFIDQ